MNLNELIKEVNKDIDDSLPNADIIQWLNRGLDDLTPYAKHQKYESIQLTTGQKNYPLPSDLFRIVYLMDEDRQKRFTHIPFDDFSSNGYKIWGKELLFQPVPKEEKEISLYYHARLPRLVNSDDIPALPEEYHDLLVLYAVSKAKYQDEEPEMESIVLREYFRRKEEFISFNQSNEVYTVQEVYW